jgi:DNA-binding HxlR family transcriptional regulator
MSRGHLQFVHRTEPSIFSSFNEQTRYDGAVGLPNDYATQSCSMARSLEVIGERWTLLIVRDAFYGIRRFSDFAVHLRIPRAVLTGRLKALAAAGVLGRGAGVHHAEYELTAKGLSLWPVVLNLIAWGDEFYGANGPRRLFRHGDDGGLIDRAGRCSHCAAAPDVADLVVEPGPGFLPPTDDDDPVTVLMAAPHRMLQPLWG